MKHYIWIMAIKRLVLVLILIGLMSILLVTPAMATVEGEDPRDPDLVYLEIRGDLDETELVGQGVPTQAYVGIFLGYSLPIWSDPAQKNEELYYSVSVPCRYDNTHDIVVEVVSVLSGAGEKGNTYQLDLAWEKVTPNEEAVPVSFHSASAQRYNLSDTQYYSYWDYFVIDYDAPADDPIRNEDEIAFRLRLGQVGGQYTDLDGELIILHVGILFPRGDLLGNPPDFDDYITEADMEELATELGGIGADFETLGLAYLTFIIVAFLIILVLWQNKIVLYAIGAPLTIVYGLSVATGEAVHSSLWVAGLAVALFGTYFLYRIVMIAFDWMRARRL